MNDTTNKLSANKQKKQELVRQMQEKVAKANAIVMTNYQGMTHKQLEDLKKSLKKVNAELAVTKNSLLTRALAADGKYPMEQNKSLQGATATLFAYEDVVLAIKELAKSIKSLKLPTIKLAVVDGQLLAESDVLRLSTLPPRDILLAQFVGGLKSPIYGLHRALNWNLQKFVMTLSAIQKAKQT